MSDQFKKSKALAELRTFCASPPVGMYSCWHFNGLLRTYPLHFLFYSQHSERWSKRQQDAKDAVIVQFNYRLKNILDFPITEADINVIEKIWEDLDKLIDHKKQENKN